MVVVTNFERGTVIHCDGCVSLYGVLSDLGHNRSHSCGYVRPNLQRKYKP